MAIGAKPPHSDSPLDQKRRREQRALWRLCGWGGAAAGSLIALAIVSQTERGQTRLQVALATFSPPPVSAPGPTRILVDNVAPRIVETEAETRRLAAQVRELTADRDRLAARLASLERNLDDMTGSIKQQPPTPAAPPAPALSAAPAVNPSPAAALRAPTSLQPVANVLPGGAPPAGPLAMAAIATNDAHWPDQAAAPLPPPERIATLPVNEAAPPPPPKLEFGVDLGGSSTIEGVEKRWAAIKANHGPMLVGLSPLIAQEQDKRPGRLPFRLIAGPFPTKIAAINLCRKLTPAHIACHSAPFEGESLAQR